jgi:phytoene dehydrogenase-like protein
MYDLIVIGDDLSSHVAAACAGSKGLSTLLISQTGLGGLQLIDDFVFNIDSMPITGLGANQPGRLVLGELGIELPESESASLNPAYQIILPDHRIDFFNDLNRMTSDLAREFPEYATEIRDYYEMAFSASTVLHDWLDDHPQIQPQSLKEFFSYLKIFPHIVRHKYGVVRFEKILSQNPSLEKVWEAQQAMLSINTNDLFSFSSAFLNCTPMNGVSYFASGKQFLFNALIDKIESAKGMYLNSYRILSIAKEKIIELEIQSKDNIVSKVSCANLIVSTKSDSLALLCDDKKRVHFSDWFRPANITHYPFTIHLGIARSCLPEQIARHVAVITNVDMDLYEQNLIILETSQPDNDKQIANERASLSATVFLPNNEDHWTKEALGNEARSILERLEAFLPFLKENIEMINLEESIGISLNYRSVLAPKYRISNALLTCFAAKNNKTRFGNIFLTGVSLLSDIGYDAEVISGKNAAMRVINKRK